MNGAQSLVATLTSCGVNVCFANPGTSEMHFVAALDQSNEMRCVLCLFEGVATGAADGFARMTGTPAATLLHTGPGLANGLANVHNAKRARSPMVNVVGDHATYHLAHDAPLTSDIAAVASPFSHWVRSAADASEVASLGAQAVAAARAAPGHIATLILPANTAWESANGPADPHEPTPRVCVTDENLARAKAVLQSGESCVLVLAGHALTPRAQRAAARIAALTGCGLRAQMSNARMPRGPDCHAIERVPYPVDAALKALSGYKNALLIGAPAPVAFFAYPNKPSTLLPPDCDVMTLAEPGDDAIDALERIATELGATEQPPVGGPAMPELPSGPLTAAKVAASVAVQMPENTIIVDEAVTSGRDFFSTIGHQRAHCWLQVTGGAIGNGPPLALGAAIACPERVVINLQADGSAMYTLQALWTQARENARVVTIIFSNRAYAILLGEMRNVGATPGAKARDMLNLDRPDLDWVALAQGMGVAGEHASSAEDFNAALARALSAEGPYLIEAIC